MKILPLSIVMKQNGELNMLNNVMALNEDEASEQLELTDVASKDAMLAIKRELYCPVKVLLTPILAR